MRLRGLVTEKQDLTGLHRVFQFPFQFFLPKLIWRNAYPILFLGLPWWLSGKNLPANAGDPGSIPGWRRSLEKKMATHSSILVREILWTEEPGRLHGVTKESAQLNN